MTDDSRNIGVALDIPEPYKHELQEWRERLGDPNAERIVPHVTLLPPTPVPTGMLSEIEEHLRRVAAKFEPFDIRLRGSATFLPVSPVVFVPLVVGIAECEQLEVAVRSRWLMTCPPQRSSGPTSSWRGTTPASGSGA
jgi:2'-5' RNA ligase